jgi:hypothetical protein
LREETLKRFFQGLASVSELSADFAGSTKHFNSVASRTEIEDMQEQFAVDRAMLVTLCEAVLSGRLSPEALRTIGFALQASDSFIWNGDQDDVLASVISDWACPEVNYPLTLENVSRFQKWLSGMEPYPDKSSLKQIARDRTISRREKIRKRGHDYG